MMYSLRLLCAFGICGWFMSAGAMEEITYEWKNSFDGEAFKRIAVEGVYECYKDLPFEKLCSGSFTIDERVGLRESLNRWTDELVWDLSRKIEEPDCSLQIITARNGADPVGFAIFDMVEYPTSVYLAELVVDPHSQRRGIGKNLVFSILQHFPEVQKIVLVTRKVNSQAVAFYPAIGFVSSDYTHPGYDPEIYRAFEFTTSKKDSVLTLNPQ